MSCGAARRSLKRFAWCGGDPFLSPPHTHIWCQCVPRALPFLSRWLSGTAVLPSLPLCTATLGPLDDCFLNTSIFSSSAVSAAEGQGGVYSSAGSRAKRCRTSVNRYLSSQPPAVVGLHKESGFLILNTLDTDTEFWSKLKMLQALLPCFTYSLVPGSHTFFHFRNYSSIFF